jgi:hypothetical protein
MRAQECADQCLDIATRTHSRKYVIKAWRLKGDIASARRQRDDAEGWLRQALVLAQEVGNPTQLWTTYLSLGRLHAEAKQSNQARQAYRTASEVIDRIKAGIQHPALRTRLDHAPLFQQVYELSASNA